MNHPVPGSNSLRKRAPLPRVLLGILVFISCIGAAFAAEGTTTITFEPPMETAYIVIMDPDMKGDLLVVPQSAESSLPEVRITLTPEEQDRFLSLVPALLDLRDRYRQDMEGVGRGPWRISVEHQGRVKHTTLDAITSYRVFGFVALSHFIQRVIERAGSTALTPRYGQWEIDNFFPRTRDTYDGIFQGSQPSWREISEAIVYCTDSTLFRTRIVPWTFEYEQCTYFSVLANEDAEVRRAILAEAVRALTSSLRDREVMWRRIGAAKLLLGLARQSDLPFLQQQFALTIPAVTRDHSKLLVGTIIRLSSTMTANLLREFAHPAAPAAAKERVCSILELYLWQATYHKTYGWPKTSQQMEYFDLPLIFTFLELSGSDHPEISRLSSSLLNEILGPRWREMSIPAIRYHLERLRDNEQPNEDRK